MSIRTKITVPAILLTVLSIAAVLTTVTYVFSHFVDNSVYTETDTFADVLESKLGDRRDESRLGAMAAAGDFSIRNALESGDREEVAKHAEQFLSQTSMDFLTITDATGVVLARAHEPDMYGDDMSGQRDVQASLLGETLTLIDEGPLVKLSVHTGQAVYNSDGVLIGTVTTGYRLDTNDFVDQMKALIDCEVTVFLGDTRIATTITQEDGSRAIGLSLDESISNQVLGGEKFSGIIDVVDNTMYAVYLPLDTGNGEIVGMIFAGRYTNTKSDVIVSFVLRSILVGIAIIAVGICSMVVVGRRVTAPIDTLVDAAQSLAQGNYDISIEIKTNDEMKVLEEAFISMIESSRMQAQVITSIANGDLSSTVELRSDKDVVGRALHTMLERNNDVFDQISEAANQVAQVSLQVAADAQMLAGTNTEQATAILELDQTVTNIQKSTARNAERSQQAAALASEIRASAVQGTQQMANMTDAVRDINEAYSSIETVIKAIEDIAFQTNILALNAAVEAARAGIHGKGFAVVADEVRNLAEKSAEAANYSADMIQDTKAKAELGSRIASETAQSLDHIVEGIGRSSALVEEISQFTAQQTGAIDQITQNTRQLSDSVQSTSILAEKTSSSCQEMSSHADRTRQLINYFHLRKKKAGPAGRMDLERHR